MYELEELVKEHDIIFLLLDSREARWLPTVLSVVHKKICMTIALGFDTFLVMRHGAAPEFHRTDVATGPRLGCYFCNDIVAPRDSTHDRTLDQQCTVSRPALCTMASSLGVELTTSLLNHPMGVLANASEVHTNCDRSVLGILPQQIRGDLGTFATNCMYGTAFERCTGCSEKVEKAYVADRESFLLQVCNNPDYLENLTGLTQMNSEMA
jgi:ubiquitin-like modifier-activating enzyme ATG7